MSAASGSKRQRQDTIAAIRPVGITDAALSKLISAVKAHPEVIEVAGSAGRIRKDLFEHSFRVLHDIELPSELRLTTGGAFAWQIAAPTKLLKLFMERCSVFRSMFLATAAAAVARHEPLTIYLYHDELTPGQVLKPDNKRKTTCFYFTFGQFGEFIRSEFAWLPVAVIRHCVTAEIEGGLGCATKLVLRSFFFGADNFSTGCVLSLETPTIVFAKLGCIIADESAIKHTFATKGASGLLPCLKCKNVVLADHGLLENDRSNYLVDISALTGYDPTTDLEMWHKCDKLSALVSRGCTKTQLEQLEKILGLNHMPAGVLADMELREYVPPCTSTVYDPMHCVYSNGIAPQELHLFLGVCKDHLGITYSNLDTWCSANWKTHSNNDKAAHGVFSARKEAASKDNFKAMASEVMAIFPLISHFVETVVRPRCPDDMKDAVESFAMLYRAHSLLTVLKRNSSKINRQSCDELKVMFREHLRLFQKAYGKEQVRPKHHLTQHLADQIFEHKLVIDCWPCERKHRALKLIATSIDNTRHFERSLLARAIEQQLMGTPADSFAFTLLGEQTSAPNLALTLGAASVKVSRAMRFGIFKVAEGDVILAERAAMEVLCCMQSDSSWCVLVGVYEFVRKHGAGVLWKLKHAAACFTLKHNAFALASYWTLQADGLMLTIE